MAESGKAVLSWEERLFAGPEGADLRLRLQRAVRRACPVWMASEVDDLTQEALLRLLVIWRKGEQKGPLPSSYLWKVAYSAMVDRVRQVRRRREFPIEQLAPGERVLEHRATPEAEGISRDLGEAIRGCLGGLTEPRRLVVGLHLLGHPLREIPPLLGWPRGRTRNLLYRGLADLRRCLSAKGYAP